MKILDYLELKSYCYNRAKNPDISPDGWEFIFENWKEYEKTFQKEKEKWEKEVKEEPFKILEGCDEDY